MKIIHSERTVTERERFREESICLARAQLFSGKESNLRMVQNENLYLDLKWETYSASLLHVCVRTKLNKYSFFSLKQSQHEQYYNYTTQTLGYKKMKPLKTLEFSQV
jgi:hypothetical protein